MKNTEAIQLIAQQFCVGVIGMYHSGVGGGGFMLVQSSNGSYEIIDFREIAPAAAFETMYSPPLSNANLSLYGGLASVVPGELRGLEYLHKNYGTMPWKHLMQPAIKWARYGFSVTEDLVRYMASATAGSYDFLTYDETWALGFAPNGTRLGLGDVMTRNRMQPHWRVLPSMVQMLLARSNCQCHHYRTAEVKRHNDSV
jgi:gamma-glutamyltranspeptidase/glutathione hydrolase